MTTSEIKKLFINLTISTFNSSNDSNLDARYFSIVCLPVDPNSNADILYLVYSPTLIYKHYFYLHTCIGDYTALHEFTYNSGDDNIIEYTADFIVDRDQFTLNQLEAVCSQENVLVTENSTPVVTEESIEIEIM
jgi:hypothetical protein